MADIVLAPSSQPSSPTLEAERELGVLMARFHQADKARRQTGALGVGSLAITGLALPPLLSTMCKGPFRESPWSAERKYESASEDELIETEGLPRNLDEHRARQAARRAKRKELTKAEKGKSKMVVNGEAPVVVASEPAAPPVQRRISSAFSSGKPGSYGPASMKRKKVSLSSSAIVQSTSTLSQSLSLLPETTASLPLHFGSTASKGQPLQQLSKISSGAGGGALSGRRTEDLSPSKLSSSSAPPVLPAGRAKDPSDEGDRLLAMYTNADALRTSSGSNKSPDRSKENDREPELAQLPYSPLVPSPEGESPRKKRASEVAGSIRGGEEEVIEEIGHGSQMQFDSTQHSFPASSPSGKIPFLTGGSQEMNSPYKAMLAVDFSGGSPKASQPGRSMGATQGRSAGPLPMESTPMRISA